MRFRNDSLDLGIPLSVIDLDPRYCFIRLWSVDAAIAVVSNVSCIEIVPQNWPIGLNFGFASRLVDIGINLGRLLFLNWV